MIFKVCGMRDPENIRRIDLSGADWMGFVFYPPSPRRVESLPAFMPEYARRVGVFVDEPVENIQVRAKEFGLNYLQLHGSESPDDCLRLQDRGLRVIKAFRIGTAGDLEATAAYEAACSYFLFDTKTPAYGGSGKTRPGFEGVPSRPAGRIRPKQPIRTGSGYQRRRKNNAIYSGYEM